MDIRKIDIKELNAAHYNPRVDLQKNDPEYQKLENSIKEFGYIDPIIWNEETGRVVGGHQRLKILKDLGHTEVSVSVVHLDEEKERTLNVALNKISGDWDNHKLAELLRDLDFDARELTGFDPGEIDDLLEDFLDFDEEAEEDDFDLDLGLSDASDTGIKEGDIIELGEHRLICGDSTKAETLQTLMGGVFSGPSNHRPAL